MNTNDTNRPLSNNNISIQISKKFLNESVLGDFTPIGRSSSFVKNNKVYSFCTCFTDKIDCRQMHEDAVAVFIFHQPSQKWLYIKRDDLSIHSSPSRIMKSSKGGEEYINYYTAVAEISRAIEIDLDLKIKL